MNEICEKCLKRMREKHPTMIDCAFRHNGDEDECDTKRIFALIISIKQMRLDTIKTKNEEIITPMGKSYCNARIQTLNDVLTAIDMIFYREVEEDAKGKGKDL